MYTEREEFLYGLAVGIMMIAPEARKRFLSITEELLAPGEVDVTQVSSRMNELLDGKPSERWANAERSEGTPDDHPKVGRQQRRAGEVTRAFLARLARDLGISTSVAGRLMTVLDTAAAREMAEKARPPIDLRVGSNGGYQLDQVRRFGALDGVTEVNGLGSRTKTYALLRALDEVES